MTTNMENEMIDIFMRGMTDNNYEIIDATDGFISRQPADREIARRYKPTECYNNIYHLGKKLARLNPTICKGHRTLNGAIEENPHYWITIKGKIWDISLSHDGTEFVWLHIVYEPEQFDRKFKLHNIYTQSWAEYEYDMRPTNRQN